MRLRVTTPVAVIEDAGDIRHIRAEDDTGAFGILPGHADFVTTLPTSVVSWRNAAGREHFVVVNGGALMVRSGMVEIATREAIRETELDRLDRKVLDQLRLARDSEDEQRSAVTRLHLATMRQIQRMLDASRRPAWPGAPDTEPGGDGSGGGDLKGPAS